MRILIADDERHVLEGLRNSIDWQQLGFDVIDLAEDGIEAYSLFLDHKPDVVVTDIYMPRMSGIQLIRKIRELDAEVPIVILSGYDDFSFAQQALRLNVSRYILKPSVPQDIVRELQDVVDETLQRRRQEQILADMHKQIKESLPILREQFLYQMLTVGLPPRELTAEKLAFYELNPCIEKSLCVMSLKALSTGTTGTEYAAQVLKGAVHAQMISMLSGVGDVYALRYVDDRIPLIVCAESEECARERSMQTARMLIDRLSAIMQLDIVIGIGRPCRNTLALPFSNRESVQALTLCESEGANTFLQFEENQSDSLARWLNYPYANLRQLTDALLCLDEKEVDATWKEMEEALVSGKPVHMPVMQFMCVSILGNLIFKIVETGLPILDSDGIARMLDSMQQAQTVKSLMEAMRQRLGELLQGLQRFSMEQSESPHVAKIKRIVARHYHEQILFGRLAEEMNISRNYLSMMFKKETGVSFMTYLTNHRIGKAKELLLQRRHMVYEIAEMTGYQDAAYFSRMFKHVTGMTPVEYIMQHE